MIFAIFIRHYIAFACRYYCHHYADAAYTLFRHDIFFAAAVITFLPLMAAIIAAA